MPFRASKLNTPRRSLRLRKGFSIIELLVAIIIIGILVAVLIPIVAGRTEQAREATVRSDLAHIADAMERVALDTGYFVRLFALDALTRGDGIGFDRGQNNDRVNGLTDLQDTVAQPYHNFVGTNGLFIDPDTGLFVVGLDRTAYINRLLSSESKYDGSASWQGPYISIRRDNNFYDGLVAPDGIADDPWGNNYLFFTKAGMVVEPTGSIAASVGYNATLGGFTTGGAFEADVFDRPTVLSLGPNGAPGNGISGGPEGQFGADDDFKVSFGR